MFPKNRNCDFLYVGNVKKQSRRNGKEGKAHDWSVRIIDGTLPIRHMVVGPKQGSAPTSGQHRQAFLKKSQFGYELNSYVADELIYRSASDPLVCSLYIILPPNISSRRVLMSVLEYRYSTLTVSTNGCRVFLMKRTDIEERQTKNPAFAVWRRIV